MIAPEDVFIEAVGQHLPSHREKILDAAAGLDPIESERLLATGYEAVAVETELYPGDMAVAAAAEALDRGGLSPDRLSMVAVTSIHRSGHKRLSSTASYVQDALGNRRAVPFNLMQGCNGSLIALTLACAHLNTAGPEDRALVVATDRFGTSSFDRYTGDYGIVYGDGAGAMVLSRRPSALRIRGVHTVSDPTLEALHRTREPLPETPELLDGEHDVRAAKRAYLAERGRETLTEHTRAAVGTIRDSLLPGDAQDGLKHIVFPSLGIELMRDNYFGVFADGMAKSLWGLSRTTGHLGSGDAPVGLYHLVEQGQLQPGDTVLLLGAGAGFTWTGVLIEVTDHA